MKSKRTVFLKAAKAAVENLFSDISVDADVTAAYLRELRDDIDMKLDALEADKKRHA